MKGLLTSTLTGLVLALVLTTPALAETKFTTLAGISAEAMTATEMDKVVGRHWCYPNSSRSLGYACTEYTYTVSGSGWGYLCYFSAGCRDVTKTKTYYWHQHVDLVIRDLRGARTWAEVEKYVYFGAHYSNQERYDTTGHRVADARYSYYVNGSGYGIRFNNWHATGLNGSW